MTDYRAKGKGDVREIYDGDRLVGRITRKRRKETQVTVNYTTGRAVINMREVDYWIGEYPDGGKVLDRHDTGNGRLVQPTIKAWTRADVWEG
jgi:hypothetical protein